MTKIKLITKSSTKRATAAAIADAKARNDWSNSDAGGALDCCEGTIRLRLDGDCPKNQMTVHELRRSLQSDGAFIANAIFNDIGFGVHRIEGRADTAADRSKASSICRAQLAVSVMLEDETITDEEILEHRATLERARDDINALLARVRPKVAAAR